MRIVSVLVLEGVVGFDLTVAGQVFGAVNQLTPTPEYEIRLSAQGRRARTEPIFGALDVRTEWDLDALVDSHTIVVPGRATMLADPPAEVLEALQLAHARGARIASVCTGAFTLGAAGLLDGRRATTHWNFAAELARRYPAIDVDRAALYVEDDNVCTSAGVAAGLDLCLHMVRQDLGAVVAADTARHTVMAPQRHGGQAQFITHPDPNTDGSFLGETLHWMSVNLQQHLTLAGIAEHANLSVRSLSRKFRSQVGMTPLQWLLHERVRAARELLESTDCGIEEVAHRTGFANATAMRPHFVRHTGIPPYSYRSSFRAERAATHDVV